MGAVIADAALQPRINYRYVVQPRVQELINAWPDAVTVTRFAQRMATEEIAVVLRWPYAAKLLVIAGLTRALTGLDVDTVTDLRDQLSEPQRRAVALRRLRAIHGVGPKTIDYLAILVGSEQHVAVDVHIRRFAYDAGLVPASYEQLRGVLVTAAEQRGCTPRALDAAVWTHMSQRHPSMNDAVTLPTGDDMHRSVTGSRQQKAG